MYFIGARENSGHKDFYTFYTNYSERYAKSYACFIGACKYPGHRDLYIGNAVNLA
jgi:hypothetical protein